MKVSDGLGKVLDGLGKLLVRNHMVSGRCQIVLVKFTLEEVHGKPLPRLCSESVRIHNNQCEVPMNSKAEWHQPVVARVVVTRELEEREEQGTRRRAGRGTGGR